METIERRLRDYKGYQVYKIIDNTTTYMLNDQNGDNVNCFTSLAELKKYVDILRR